VVVSESSPLVYLAALGDFWLLRTLFGSVTIPPAVYDEVVTRGGRFPVSQAVRAALGDWRRVQGAARVEHRWLLQEGETEAIALAQEVSARALLLDDRRVFSQRGCRKYFLQIFHRNMLRLGM